MSTPVVTERLKVNRLVVVEIERVFSKLYQHPYRTGRLLVRCLDCGSLLWVSQQNIRPNDPSRSKWSCGCTKRRKAKRAFKPRPESSAGRPPLELDGLQFGLLMVLRHVRLEGWLCACKCGATQLVRHTYLLTRGVIRGCEKCDWRGWAGKSGPKPKGYLETLHQ
jgi:hypothetical protein